MEFRLDASQNSTLRVINELAMYVSTKKQIYIYIYDCIQEADDPQVIQ